MSDCTMERWLNDWLDGELSPDERAAFERHAPDCPTCRRAVDDAQRIRQWARALPEEEAPTRDLWDAIASEIEPRTVPREIEDRPAAPGVHRVPWTWAAAAAILLSLSTSAATALWLGAPPPVSTAALPTEDSTEALAAAWEGDLRTATDELTAAIEARRDELDPETWEIVQRNLAIIDAAIAETREALAASPGDGRARDALVAAYNQKIRVLQRTLKLPAT